jgi:hypothetical protein
MNREIKFIRHRLKKLDRLAIKLRKKDFELSEVFEDIVLEIKVSIKKIEKQLEKQGKKVALIKKKKVKKKDKEESIYVKGKSWGEVMEREGWL